jgi:uncharacterized membrane protein YhaH (DUF805 family)
MVYAGSSKNVPYTAYGLSWLVCNSQYSTKYSRLANWFVPFPTDKKLHEHPLVGAISVIVALGWLTYGLWSFESELRTTNCYYLLLFPSICMLTVFAVTSIYDLPDVASSKRPKAIDLSNNLNVCVRACVCVCVCVCAWSLVVQRFWGCALSHYVYECVCVRVASVAATSK